MGMVMNYGNGENFHSGPSLDYTDYRVIKRALIQLPLDDKDKPQAERIIAKLDFVKD